MGVHVGAARGRYLRVNKDNIASQKVMLKNGARITGEDSEHFFMRIPK